MDTTPLQISPHFQALFEDAQTRVKEISIDEVEQLLQHDSLFYLLDVREKEEFDVTSIPGAIHLSKGWLEAKIHLTVPNQQDMIILYCGGGHRSLLAADNLQKMGYNNVFSMSGGIKAWARAGKKLY
ncbi:MAG: sulfurtransferase [Legionellales bacterium]|nr:sulfurtransferase [Legionellales bacterium]